ncbi:hypothetical protein DFH08DRAFT_683383 [Mycena albidolilacea]|uniref:Uncharacterized protein n=1 Tax=Mycena albidolilacea TaxID=1033008 RepID=A0AAD7ALG6_9AGAR|nr:hypothetical protein DFH08DRAFT_683383 [Mycena albidolilacea]
MEIKLDSISGCWQWTGNYYLRIDSSTKDAYATHKHFILEVPSIILQPLGSTLGKIPTSELVDIMDLAWQMLDPESEQVLANIEMLPQVTNPSLPYHDSSGKSPIIRT